MWYGDEASADGTCFTDGSGTWSLSEQCDVSGEQPRIRGVFFPDVGDCSGAGEEYENAADGSCVDYGGGIFYRYYCGEHVDEWEDEWEDEYAVVPRQTPPCATDDECRSRIDCNQPDMVICYEGQCYTGTLDDRCANQPNNGQPGSPHLRDGGWCWDGQRDQVCDGVIGDDDRGGDEQRGSLPASMIRTATTSAATTKAGGTAAPQPPCARMEVPRIQPATRAGMSLSAQVPGARAAGPTACAHHVSHPTPYDGDDSDYARSRGSSARATRTCRTTATAATAATLRRTATATTMVSTAAATTAAATTTAATTPSAATTVTTAARTRRAARKRRARRATTRRASRKTTTRNYVAVEGDDHDYCPITREFCESDEDLPDNCNCGDCGYPACGDCDCDHYGEHCCTGNDGGGHDGGDHRYSGAEFRSSDCSGAPVRTWNEPSFPSDEASAADFCVTDDGSWSVNNEWCDDSGAQMRVKYVYFPSVGDCTGAERYDQDHPADGSCVDLGGGTSIRFFCGGHVDEFLRDGYEYAVESDDPLDGLGEAFAEQLGEQIDEPAFQQLSYAAQVTGELLMSFASEGGVCGASNGAARSDLRTRMEATLAMSGATWDKAVDCLCNTLDADFVTQKLDVVIGFFERRMGAATVDGAIDAVIALVGANNAERGLLGSTTGVCTTGTCLQTIKDVMSAIIPRVFAAVKMPTAVATLMEQSALDLLSCMCSGLDLGPAVRPILRMVFPLIADVESSDRFDRLSLTQIIDRGQNAIASLMSDTVLCKTQCKATAGAVLHFTMQAAISFASDASNTWSALIGLPSYPFPPLPESTAADIDASIDCLCGFSLGSFLTPIKGALGTFLTIDRPTMEAIDVINDADLFDGVAMNAARLVDVALSSDGLCGSGCDVAMSKMTKLFSGYALDLAAPSGDSTVPQALKAGVVNYVDAFRGCMCGGIKAVPIVETLAPFGAALQRLLRGAEGDDSLIWADFLPALQSSLKSLFRKLLSPAGGVCGGPCADLGGKAFDLSLSFEQTVNEFLGNEEDLNYIRDTVKSFTESSLFQESGALRDVWAQLPNDLTIDALLRTPFFYTPSNLRATYDAWGSCACGSEISFDPLLDAVFEDLVVPLIRNQFTFALGQGSDDFQPLLEKLVPYLLGPQLLCGGKCKAAFGSTLASIFDVRSARAFLRDADLFLGLSLDPILSGFLGDSNGENINLGGLPKLDTIVGASIPDTLPSKIGSLSSCICGVGEAGWETAIDGVVDILMDVTSERFSVTKTVVLEWIEFATAPDFVLCNGLCPSSIFGVVSDVTTALSNIVGAVSDYFTPSQIATLAGRGNSGSELIPADVSNTIKDVADQIGSLLPAKETFVEMANTRCMCAEDTKMDPLADALTPIVRGLTDGGGIPEGTDAAAIVATVVDTMTVCPASEAQKAEPPKKNALRFAVTAAKKDDVDLTQYKKNLADHLGVDEKKVQVAERIKHKVKATYVLKQTLDEFESSGMRQKIKTRIAIAAGVSEDAVEVIVTSAERRRRLAAGVTVETTITTDDKETATAAKEKLPKTKAAASTLLDTEVAEEPEAPTQEEVTELEATIIADTPMDEATIAGGLDALAASDEAASTALGLEVADADNAGFVSADELSPPSPMAPPAPPSPPPPSTAPSPPAIPQAIEDAINAALALPVAIIVVIAVLGFLLVVVCPLIICIICCCCMKTRRAPIPPLPRAAAAAARPR